MRLGLLANLNKSGAEAALRRAAMLAKQHQLPTVCTAEFAPLVAGAQVVPEADLASAIDVLMVLGGDGTLLSGVRILAGAPVPVIGINLGKLGFMTCAPAERLDDAITAIVRGTAVASSRAMLECEVGGRSMHALNDVVLGWGVSSRTASISARVNGDLVTTYSCDGLIVATPTGSTGHALSAGGPILHPETPAFVLSVICPHALTVRPLVVHNDSTVQITIEHSSKPLVLSVDGRQEPELPAGAELTVRRSPRSVRLLHLPGYSYFGMLRNKLNWRGSAIFP